MNMLYIAALFLAAAALAGIAYQVAAAWLVWQFARATAGQPVDRPGVSVLKPLHGEEPGLAENLRALCRQDYPGFQIVCGTLDPGDPALPVASAVRDEFPEVDMIVIGGRVAPGDAKNRKVANLENLMAHAKHDILVLADSDVRAGVHCLGDAVAALEARGIGIATCLYVGRPEPDLWSRLEALWINHAFLPSALVARAVGRHDGCFGATIALHRETLERVGGLARLRDALADDWALGAAVRRLGLGIGLVARPVEIVVHHPNMGSMLAHELRWGRTIAALDRVGYSASVVTQPVVFALLAALAGLFAAPFLAVLVTALAARLIAIRVQEWALGLGRAPIYLLVLREFLTFALFVAALSGRTVRWRGLRYRIRPDGTMQPLEDNPR